jgi:hypothetical protein
MLFECHVEVNAIYGVLMTFQVIFLTKSIQRFSVKVGKIGVILIYFPYFEFTQNISA